MSVAAREVVDWPAVAAEATTLLTDLIRLDTTNPPGGESQAAEYLADVLRGDGIDVTLLEATPGRANLVARLCGQGEQPPCLFLAHTDVVYADAAEWRVPPFAGAVRDGYVWGRGAVDMKGLLAMQVMALRLARRLDMRLDRDFLLLASADEEDAGRYGAGWVVDHHWDTVACGLALGEGGVGIDLGDRPLFLVATAEKVYADLRLTARGQGSHASTPHPDNALVRLARAIDRLAAYRPPARLTPPVVEQMAALAPYLPRSEQLTLAAMRAPALADWLADRVMQPTLRHAFRNTFTPTLARAGRQPNVVPHHAEATVNCRVLPGVSCDDLLAETRRAVADANVDVEAQQFNPASASPTRTAFFDALAAAVRSEHPGAAIIPYMMSGATDARHFRARGVTAYGLMPVVLGADEMSGIHGIDERLRAAHLEHGTRVLYHFLRGFTTRP